MRAPLSQRALRSGIRFRQRQVRASEKHRDQVVRSGNDSDYVSYQSAGGLNESDESDSRERRIQTSSGCATCQPPDLCSMVGLSSPLSYSTADLSSEDLLGTLSCGSHRQLG